MRPAQTTTAAKAAAEIASTTPGAFDAEQTHVGGDEQHDQAGETDAVTIGPSDIIPPTSENATTASVAHGVGRRRGCRPAPPVRANL